MTLRKITVLALAALAIATVAAGWTWNDGIVANTPSGYFDGN